MSMRQLSLREIRDFAEIVIDEAALESAVQWIATNLLPEDVFPEDVLEDCAKDWATDNGWTEPDQILYDDGSDTGK